MTEILRYAAFTTDPALGNPAGVVLDAGGLDAAKMQQIAAEVGYSETAFAVPSGERRYAVRYFSPLAEVDFCGHATIATAVAIAEREGAGPLVFDTNVGPIEVGTERSDDTDGVLTASLRSVATRTRAASDGDLAEALAALGWQPTDLDPAYPAHVAFGGVEHLVLAAGSRERLADLDYDFEALKALMTDRGWTTVQLFWRENETRLHARNPFPIGGVVEDPATGAAAAALGGYLRDLGAVTEPTRLTISQGEDMGQQSELSVAIDPAEPTITVSGAGVAIPN
ncbi:PhzF family phenazine biosynthesis isomerase [Nocardioides speluncae]|uniref:PhzF family phenazine biosynthesis isomerase n=1 Tax=Nocardioides speluncae TaxID=2670337 RepID=UPI000D6998F1|nr:PhzF family phenazine biosynthesis isomerase [Nocardioides speluncae]